MDRTLWGEWRSRCGARAWADKPKVPEKNTSEGGLIRPLNFILFFVFSSPSMTAANMQRKILGGNQRKKKERM